MQSPGLTRKVLWCRREGTRGSWTRCWVTKNRDCQADRVGQRQGDWGKKAGKHRLGRQASGMQESEQVKSSSMGYHLTGQNGRNGLQCHLSCIRALKEEGF